MSIGFGATLGTDTTDVVSFTSSISSDWSFAGWWYRRDAGGNNLGRLWNHNNGTSAYYAKTGNFLYVTRDTDGTSGTWRYNGASSLSTWYHVVITQSGTSAPTIYINGAPVTVSQTQAPTGSPTTTADTQYIGNSATSDRVWDGNHAEFAWWDVVLDAGEAKAVYTGSPLRVRPQSLTAYLPLVRSIYEYIGGAAVSVTGTAVQPHPRMVYSRRHRIYVPAAVVGGDLTQTITATGHTVTASDWATGSRAVLELVAAPGAETLTTSDPTTERQLHHWWEPFRVIADVGAVESGTIADTWTNNDAFLVLTETTGTPGFQYEFRWEGIPSADDVHSLHIHGYYDAPTPAHVVKISQYNFFGPGSWTDLTGSGVKDLPAESSEQEYSFPIYTSVDYYSNGEMRFRITHESAGNLTHRLRLDQLVLAGDLAGTPGAETVTITDTVTAAVTPLLPTVADETLYVTTPPALSDVGLDPLVPTVGAETVTATDVPVAPPPDNVPIVGLDPIIPTAGTETLTTTDTTDVGIDPLVPTLSAETVIVTDPPGVAAYGLDPLEGTGSETVTASDAPTAGLDPLIPTAGTETLTLSETLPPTVDLYTPGTTLTPTGLNEELVFISSKGSLEFVSPLRISDWTSGSWAEMVEAPIEPTLDPEGLVLSDGPTPYVDWIDMPLDVISPSPNPSETLTITSSGALELVSPLTITDWAAGSDARLISTFGDLSVEPYPPEVLSLTETLPPSASMDNLEANASETVTISEDEGQAQYLDFRPITITDAATVGLDPLIAEASETVTTSDPSAEGALGLDVAVAELVTTRERSYSLDGTEVPVYAVLGPASESVLLRDGTVAGGTLRVQLGLVDLEPTPLTETVTLTDWATGSEARIDLPDVLLVEVVVVLRDAATVGLDPLIVTHTDTVTLSESQTSGLFPLAAVPTETVTLTDDTLTNWWTLEASGSESLTLSESVTADRQWMVAATVPGTRTWRVRAQSRTWRVPAQSRTWAIRAESRTWAVDTEDRTWRVRLEER